MAKLKAMTKFLDKELSIKKIKDYSKNGLQVKAKTDIQKVGFAVDACISTFEKAKKQKVDLLIVHHGIKWRKDKYPFVTRLRESYCKKNKISLYGAHLPLDLHKIYGNNIQLAEILGISKVKKFHSYHGVYIGYKCNLSKIFSLNQIAAKLNHSLNTKSDIHLFGKNKIKSIGICSGGGASAIEEAVKERLDCLLTGEIDIGDYNRAKDFRLSLIASGHYATETVGVKALMPLIQKTFKVKVVFIDNPTGI